MYIFFNNIYIYIFNNIFFYNNIFLTKINGSHPSLRNGASLGELGASHQLGALVMPTSEYLPGRGQLASLYTAVNVDVQGWGVEKKLINLNFLILIKVN